MMLRASTPAHESDSRRALLQEFVDAVVGDDGRRAAAARDALLGELGPEWLVDASSVVANFEMMTRLADGTGARLRPAQIAATAEMRAAIGVDEFPSARV